MTETKKDPGIPNEWPFKEELLNEIQAQKNEVNKIKLEMRDGGQHRLRLYTIGRRGKVEK